jgi:hypothetical protein
MIALADSINAQMHLCAAGHLDGNFLAEEEIGMVAQRFNPVDGVVVGYGYNGHAELLQPLVHFRRVVVGLAADAAQARSVEHSRSNRVNMKVTSHGIILGPDMNNL